MLDLQHIPRNNKKERKEKGIKIQESPMYMQRASTPPHNFVHPLFSLPLLLVTTFLRNGF